MWAAAQANGVHVFIHTQTGGVKVNDPESTTLKVVMESAAQVNQPMTEKSAAKRMITQCIYGPIVPQQVICELIGGGVPERYPGLHFALIEFNAHWLASLMGAMDKCWVTGIGQDADWWLGRWDDDRPDDDQPNMAQLFRLNEKWPYPLTPSEYVQRQFHIQFQDDPVAVATRHITGISSIVWGNDYPHAEGTFRGSRELLATQLGGLPADERAAIVGGTLGRLLGFEAPATAQVPGCTTTSSKDRSRSLPARDAASARAYARLLADRGARVVVNDLGGAMDGVGADAEPAASVVAEIVDAGGLAIPDDNDVSGAAGAQALVDAAVGQFGRIDIVINNAGIIRWAGLPDADADNLERHLAVHVGGSFNTTRAPPGRTWSNSDYGRVVMTTSDGDVRTARTISRTQPPRVRSSDSRAASTPRARRTASWST